MTVEYDKSLFFSTIKFTRFLKLRTHSFLAIPFVAKTRGVNVPRSMMSIRYPHTDVSSPFHEHTTGFSLLMLTAGPPLGV